MINADEDYDDVMIMLSMSLMTKNDYSGDDDYARQWRLTLTTTFTFSPPWLSSILHHPQLLYLLKPGVAKMTMAREIVTLEAKALSC